MAKQKRFEVIEEQDGFLTSYQVVRDRETGVCYFQAQTAAGTALTPLLGTDGRPVVDHATPPIR